MPQGKEEWYNSDDPRRVVRGATWFGLSRGTAIVVAILVVSALVGAGVWAVKVATSDVKGKGDTIIQKNDANNRVSSQAFFEDTYAGIKSLDQRLADAQKAIDDFKTANPLPSAGEPVKLELYRQELTNRQNTFTGLQNQCRTSVGEYNAEARKTLRGDWRAGDLPYQIDTSNPATDCLPAQ